MAGMPSRVTAPRYLRPIFGALAVLAVALAVTALATPAHGLPGDEANFSDSGPEASSFVVDTGEPGDELEEECFEEEGESDEAEEVEGEGDEGGETQECEAEAQGSELLPPEECLLRTASARVFTSDAHDKVRLVLRYTALAPTEVAVDYRLKGGKGSLQFNEARKRFATRGVFRANETLTEAQMNRVLAAKSFQVQLHVPAAPAFCNRYYSKHLTIRRGGNNHAVWSEPDSSS
jgi:hypothetical protein